MRELKFRVWDSWKVHFGQDSPLYFSLEDGYLMECGRDGIEEADKDRYVLNQFTGLRDKNGKEVYEGDCLGGNWEGGYISWCNKCGSFQLFFCDGECAACGGDVYWYDIAGDSYLEIIGNLYENPDIFGTPNE